MYWRVHSVLMDRSPNAAESGTTRAASPILALSRTHLRLSTQRQVSGPITIVLNLAQQPKQVAVCTEVRNCYK